jgi:hypothetical protein
MSDDRHYIEFGYLKCLLLALLRHGKGRARRPLLTTSVLAFVLVTFLSVERTLREVARVAYADPRRLFRADGTLVPIVELDEDAAGMIAAIEVDEEGRTTRVRMWDKNQALEKALKYLGLYERENTRHSENLELQVVLVGKP